MDKEQVLEVVVAVLYVLIALAYWVVAENVKKVRYPKTQDLDLALRGSRSPSRIPVLGLSCPDLKRRKNMYLIAGATLLGAVGFCLGLNGAFGEAEAEKKITQHISRIKRVKNLDRFEEKLKALEDTRYKQKMCRYIGNALVFFAGIAVIIYGYLRP